MPDVEILVKGRINPDWSEWLHDLSITFTEKDESLLTGDLPDQAALYGLMSRLRDLGLGLVSVRFGGQETK